MGLLRKLFWVALFVVFTFSFVILFEHGTENFFRDFSKNAQLEYARLEAYTAPATLKQDDGGAQ
ncbi:MAG TPA: hypothetical protein VF585_01275 [Chthoniobacterales bacterium]|jgi:hypothetical protein